MKEPLVIPLISLTKKYVSAFSTLIESLDIERYQYVLVLIEEKEEKLTQKELSEILNLDKSYMVSIIDYLSEKGYVYRRKNQQDRRKQSIMLTDKARQHLPVIKSAFTEINDQAFKGLTSKQIKDLDNIIKTIEENLINSDPSSIIFDIKRLSL